MSLEQSRIEAVLGRFGEPERQVMDRLIPALYERLRELAHYRLQAAPGERSLNTTGLVHEAYLRLAESLQATSLSQEHFLAIASRVMRNVLVDQARTRNALKRGAGVAPLPLREEIRVGAVDLDTVADLDEALQGLETINRRQSDIVELYYFGGLSLEETAATLGLSLATVKRDLRLARAWLAASLTDTSP